MIAKRTMQRCIICLEEGTNECTHKCTNKKKHIDTNTYTNSIMYVVSIAIVSIVGRLRLITPNFKCK